ncbi:GSCOCG00003018001-RA-CDS [Cotesia congregata]|nr:GSCOCG00003018001-RA-CDS [Cotesia congregata]
MAEDRQEVKNMHAVLCGIRKFSTDFHKTISGYDQDNIIYSPLSIGIMLSMAAYGANETTEQQLISGLHLPEDKEANKNGFEKLVDTFSKMEKVRLVLGQKVFVSESYEVRHDFKQTTKNVFGSSTRHVNFKHSSEVVKAINKWCGKKTNDAITRIIDSHDINDAIMILASVAYFSGPWLLKFDSENTRPRLFNIDEKTTKHVDTMYQLNSFNYGPLPDLDAIYIELPYEKHHREDATSMFVILPNQIGGLSKVEDNLDQINFASLVDHHLKTEIYLHMPKFKVESNLNLEPFLEKMEMSNMFRDDANFSGISERQPLKISKIIQKALIEVHEHGTEAATTTDNNVLFESSRSWHTIPITVDVNRPFVFVIYHNATNSILLQGHVKSPMKD